MNLKVQNHGGTATVHLAGTLTIGAPVDTLHRAVSTLLQQGVREIRLNLRGLRFADGSGLGAIVACHRQADAAGAVLWVEGLGGKLREIFGVTGLDRLASAGSPKRGGGLLGRRAVPRFNFSGLSFKVA